MNLENGEDVSQNSLTEGQQHMLEAINSAVENSKKRKTVIAVVKLCLDSVAQ